MLRAVRNATILLVEDHADLAATTGAYLEGLGFIMDYAGDGLTALNLLGSEHYDCVVLDLMLPKVDGIEVCKSLRRDGLSIPVIMLTARDQLADKLQGFDTGADDYLVKPFEMEELAARITSLIRRQRGEFSDSVLRVGDLEFDQQLMHVHRNGQRLTLSPTCLRILRMLMRESPKLVTREALEQELWGDVVPDSDTLRSHLYNLRKAIDRPFDSKLLHTIQGVGFKLVPADQV